MAKHVYYLTFCRRLDPTATGEARYGEQVTVFTEAAPFRAYAELKKLRTVCAAYGREGASPIKDTHPGEPWDTYGGVLGPSGAKS